jgi:S1-C subfamily serine protease
VLRGPRLLAVAVATLAAALAPDARADALASLEAEQTALYDRIAPGVAVLSAGGAIGAGFAVAPGLLLTAAHVVEGARDVDVLLRDGRTFRGEVVERAAGGLDVALVRIPASPPILELAQSASLRPGSVIASVGHPDGSHFVLGTGVVAQAQADGSDASLVRLQMPLRPGASGGPVVDRTGRVVGVVALGAPGTVAFAVRAEAAARALAGLAGVPLAEGARIAAGEAIPGAVPLSAPGVGARYSAPLRPTP